MLRRFGTVMATTLVALVACYDFSLPEDGSGGAGSGAADPSSGGGGAAAAQGGAAGGPTFSPPCDQWSCEQCAACTVDFLFADAAACEAYDDCFANCMGSSSCEAGCQGSYPAGLFLRESLDNQCGEICAGMPPCDG